MRTIKEETVQSDARATLENSILSALLTASPGAGLTPDKCDKLVIEIIKEIFEPAVVWSVKDYLRELGY